MGLASTLAPAGDVLGGGLKNIAKFWWILVPIVVIISLIAIVWLIGKIRKKNSQWTHKLIVRRVIGNENTLSAPIIHRMRRFPLIKGAEVFELEKPLLGGYLIPELAEYSGENEYSIILDKNNRIWTPTKETFVKELSSVNVSARHAEIDIQRRNLKDNFQNVNRVAKRLEWATIARYAFMTLGLIVFMVIAIVAINKWGDAKEFEAQSDQAQAQAMENLASAMKTIEKTVNTQQIQISMMLEGKYDRTEIQKLLAGGN